MNQFWQVAISLAGLGGVASFVIWSLYREWLRLPIFQQLTKKHQFTLFMAFMILTFLFALAALVTYAVVQRQGDIPQKDPLDTIAAVQKYLLTFAGGQKVAMKFFPEGRLAELSIESSESATGDVGQAVDQARTTKVLDSTGRTDDETGNAYATLERKPNTSDVGAPVIIAESAWCCKNRKGRIIGVRPPSQGRPFIVKVANAEGSGDSGAVIAFESSELILVSLNEWPIPNQT